MLKLQRVGSGRRHWWRAYDRMRLPGRLNYGLGHTPAEAVADLLALYRHTDAAA